MQSRRVCVVIPTYNEARNIKLLLETLEAVLENISGYDTRIAVADDMSPDGTGSIVLEVAEKYRNIQLFSDEREGMGAALKKVFSHIADQYDIIVTMDADFSHPPEMIPQFLEKIESSCDMVVGSRYIEGGRTPDWPLKRKLISSLANILARTVGGLHSVHDCTSNYRAYKASIVRTILFHQVPGKGYAFVTTVLWEALHQEAHVCEIPLVFYDRAKGDTKLRFKDILEYLFNCFKLRWRSFNGS